MNTFKTSTGPWFAGLNGTGGGYKRWVWAGLLMLILSGCSVVQSLYNNAPQLVYWWLDDYVDFRADQKDWVKVKLNEVLAWHRASQLPLYRSQIKKLADLATSDISPEVGCGAVQALIDTHDAWAEQLSAPLAEFVQSMSSSQVQHLQAAFEKKNKEWSKEWLWVSDKERLEHQTDKGIEQAQDLYGKLTASQKDALRELAKDSGYDPQKSLALRRARQQETLKAIEQLRTLAKTPDKGRPVSVAAEKTRPNDSVSQREALETNPATSNNNSANYSANNALNSASTPPSAQSLAVVREWLNNILDPVDPSLRSYNTLRWNMNCQSSSRFHSLTTPEQRLNARARLLRYARDAQELMDKAP